MEFEFFCSIKHIGLFDGEIKIRLDEKKFPDHFFHLIINTIIDVKKYFSIHQRYMLCESCPDELINQFTRVIGAKCYVRYTFLPLSIREQFANAPYILI